MTMGNGYTTRACAMLLRHDRIPGRTRRALVVPGVLVLSGLLMAGDVVAQPDAGWDDLVSLDTELAALRAPQRQGGVPQFGVDAITARADATADVQSRLRNIDASSWSVAGKVDSYPFEEGALVRRGKTLAQLRTVQLKFEIAAAEAAVTASIEKAAATDNGPSVWTIRERDSNRHPSQARKYPVRVLRRSLTSTR